MPTPMSALLSPQDLDFAIEHIIRYYDTDFYPRVAEFEALRFNWPDARAFILKGSMDDLLSASPVVEPWPKPRSGYRIVHQLEPLDVLIYTALAKKIAPAIEDARATPEIACSYRFSISEDGFFTEGSGFNVYRERCTNLANNFPFVLTLDIADFYNKIYLHRLQNAIQSAIDDPPAISKRIEYLLMALNTKASQGIPIGPAASIIMSEATLIDADQYFFSRNFEHVRYVDDFRVFANSKRELEILLQEFGVYLHENHRLSLAAEKTRVVDSQEFIRKELNNQYQLEKLEILSEIEVVNPYTLEVEDVELAPIENAGEVLLDALQRITKFETLDLGVIRAIVRRARAHGIRDIALFLLENIRFFAPAINDVVLYLNAITDDDFIKLHQNALIELCDSDAVDIRAVRLWLEWYFSGHKKLLLHPKIRAFVFSSKKLRPQARAAIELDNQAWVKERKNQLMHYASWDRRSIILAARVLSKDEREKWLAPMSKNPGLSFMDRCMIDWVIADDPEF